MTTEAMDERSDRELADRVLADGDEASFRILYRRHTPRLYAVVLRFLGGEEARTEDVIQDTWIRAVEGLAGFRWEATLGTWLTGIALNRAREVIRKRGRLVFDERPALQGTVPTPRPGRRLDVERALRALPDGYRTVLLLHDVEGYTHPEISGLLEIAVGTSKSQLHHARRALRQLLEGPGPEESDHDGTTRRTADA